MEANSNMLALTEKESGQYKPAQSHNLDIVPLSNQSGPFSNSQPSEMQIENVYGTMIQRIKDLGEFCKGSWSAVDHRISSLEEQNITVESAIRELVLKDNETTKIISNQCQFAENALLAFNWLKATLEQTQGDMKLSFNKVSEWCELNKKDYDSENLSQVVKDTRALIVSKELNDDKVLKIANNLENVSNGLDSAKNQINLLQLRLNEFEAQAKRSNSQHSTSEDRLQILETRVREIQKNQEPLVKVDQLTRENGRDLLILEEDVSKLKKSLTNLEEKTNKNQTRKMSKNEKSCFEEIEVDVIKIKERVNSLEVLTEHLNDVKYEDFARRFKKEIYENTDTQIVKVSQGLKQIEEQTNLHAKANDNLQKSLLELRKKLDHEMIKLQDINFSQANEAKWSQIDTKLAELNSNYETLLKKTQQHDHDILGISENVYDYSFKEMASSFDERVDNRLSNCKQQINTIRQQISELKKKRDEECETKILLTKINKLIENKLDAYTEVIEQRISRIANIESNNQEIPVVAENGKKILYKSGSTFLNPKDIIISNNGSLMWNKKDNNEMRGTRDDHKIKNPSANKSKNQIQENPFQKRCIYDNTCPTTKCPYIHTKKVCGGFVSCKKQGCQRRHHPDRVVTNNKREDNHRKKFNDNIFPYPDFQGPLNFKRYPNHLPNSDYSHFFPRRDEFFVRSNRGPSPYYRSYPPISGYDLQYLPFSTNPYGYGSGKPFNY